jgi:hypothetical protein
VIKKVTIFFNLKFFYFLVIIYQNPGTLLADPDSLNPDLDPAFQVNPDPVPDPVTVLVSDPDPVPDLDSDSGF